MKDGHYEIIVFNPRTKAQYAERVINGKTYVVAEPGEEYKVMVVINEPSAVFPRDSCVTFYLLVDGHSVGHKKFFKSSRLDNTRIHATFEGFSKSVGDAENVYAFTFAAENSSDPTEAFSNTDMGCLKLQVYYGKQRRVDGDEKHEMNPVHSDTKLVVHENEKFWQQPSVTTQMGQQLHLLDRRSSGLRMSSVRHLAHEMSLQFHTVPFLDLLQRIESSSKEALDSYEAVVYSTHRRINTGVSAAEDDKIGTSDDQNQVQSNDYVEQVVIV